MTVEEDMALLERIPAAIALGWVPQMASWKQDSGWEWAAGGIAIADGWITAVVSDRSEWPVTCDRDGLPLLPPYQVVVLEP